MEEQLIGHYKILRKLGGGGMGIGKRLVEECIRFSRRAGYRKITLWTQSILHAARHIYEQAGFHVVQREQHHSFGKDLTAETWELELRPASEGRPKFDSGIQAEGQE